MWLKWYCVIFAVWILSKIVMEYCGGGSVSDIMRLRRKTVSYQALMPQLFDIINSCLSCVWVWNTFRNVHVLSWGCDVTVSNLWTGENVAVLRLLSTRWQHLCLCIVIIEICVDLNKCHWATTTAQCTRVSCTFQLWLKWNWELILIQMQPYCAVIDNWWDGTCWDAETIKCDVNNATR